MAAAQVSIKRLNYRKAHFQAYSVTCICLRLNLSLSIHLLSHYSRLKLSSMKTLTHFKVLMVQNFEEIAKRRPMTICPSCFVYLLQSRAPPPRNALGSSWSPHNAFWSPHRSFLCIDFTYIRIRTAARSQLSLRCNQCGIKRITKNNTLNVWSRRKQLVLFSRESWCFPRLRLGKH